MPTRYIESNCQIKIVSTKKAHGEGGKVTYVVRSVRVVVHTAEERRRRVAADVLREKMTATGVLVQEGRNIVDEARNEDQRTLLRLLLD